MKIEVVRDHGTVGYTHGVLTINGLFECHTLEDEVHEVKIPGETAIPAGVYKVIISFSNRFQRDMPLLLNVPNFEGIRIHSGNTAADTHGCILVGASKSEQGLLASRIAYDKLFSKILAEWSAHEDIWIKIA